MRIYGLASPALLLLLFSQPLYAATEPRERERVLVLQRGEDVAHPAHRITVAEVFKMGKLNDRLQTSGLG